MVYMYAYRHGKSASKHDNVTNISKANYELLRFVCSELQHTTGADVKILVNFITCIYMHKCVKKLRQIKISNK